MGRTQIYLGATELALLDRAAGDTGASRSELIRRAVQESYGALSKEEKRRILRATAGAWKHNREQSGAEYVDSIRGDMNERLAELGFDE